MGFISPPKPKAPPPPANAPITAKEGTTPFLDPFVAPASLISTGAQGLKRKAAVQRTSLIGGY